MFLPVDHPEPGPEAALEHLRARLRADHLAELAVLDEVADIGDLGWTGSHTAGSHTTDPAGATADGPGGGPAADGTTRSVGDPVAEALAIIEAALQADPGALGDAALDARVVACDALVDRAKALQAVTVGAWAPRGGWLEGFPVSSAAGWLDHQTGISRPDAHRVLATGRVIAEHPAVADAVRSGRLSCRKAEVLGSLPGRGRGELFARDVEVLVDAMAGVDWFESVTTIARRWKALADDEAAAADAGAAYDQRSFHHSQVGGRWKTNGTFDLADGATFDAALRAALDPPDAPDVPGGPRTLAQRKADAVVRLAECWLARHNQDHPARPVPSATIHLTPDAVCGTSAAGFDPATVCDLVPGGPVPRATAQQLLCDSVVGRVILDAEGEVIDLGRTKRLFSPAQRKAMIARDGPFCVMGSGTPAADCQAHHLDFFTDGGRTDLADGAHISKPIHHAIHHRGYTLTRLEPGVYQLTAPDGRVWTSRITGWGTSVTTNF